MISTRSFMLAIALLIVVQICSEGKPNDPSKPHKLRSLKTSVLNRSKGYWNSLKRLPKKMKPLIAWIRKYIDFGIKCQRHTRYQIICRTKLAINGKQVFTIDVWNKIPKFLRNRLIRYGEHKSIRHAT
uniref:Uncharacterized protein n=1 Tax=Schizaphis graminum TaxID=13262 RepID=A0A2S2NZL8_SCHGA